jgi:hypothetical protein
VDCINITTNERRGYLFIIRGKFAFIEAHVSNIFPSIDLCSVDHSARNCVHFIRIELLYPRARRPLNLTGCRPQCDLFLSLCMFLAFNFKTLSRQPNLVHQH